MPTARRISLDAMGMILTLIRLGEKLPALLRKR